jgi:hypothetical protein
MSKEPWGPRRKIVIKEFFVDEIFGDHCTSQLL